MFFPEKQIIRILNENENIIIKCDTRNSAMELVAWLFSRGYLFQYHKNVKDTNRIIEGYYIIHPRYKYIDDSCIMFIKHLDLTNYVVYDYTSILIDAMYEENIAVHCDTEEQQIRFIRYLKRVRSTTEISFDFFDNKDKDKTYYYMGFNRMLYKGNVEVMKSGEFKIIEFKDLFKESTKRVPTIDDPVLQAVYQMQYTSLKEFVILKLRDEVLNLIEKEQYETLLSDKEGILKYDPISKKQYINFDYGRNTNCGDIGSVIKKLQRLKEQINSFK